MLWHNLRTSHPYAAWLRPMFVLVAALAVFLIVRTDALNQQIGNLSVQVHDRSRCWCAADLPKSRTHNKRSTATFSNPHPIILRNTSIALQSLTAEIGSARGDSYQPQQHQRLDAVASRVATYQRDFQTLSTLLDQQQATLSQLNTHLNDATSVMNDVMTVYLTTSKPDSTVLAVLVRAQRHFKLTMLSSSRLDTEQTEDAQPARTRRPGPGQFQPESRA